MGKGKYFIAIIMRGDAFAEAERLKQELKQRFGLGGALRSPAHITLHRPFEWKEEKEDELLAGLGDFQSVAPFHLRVEGFGSFSQRVAFIAVKESEVLNRLHEKLKRFAKERLGLLNEWEDERGFHPHVTVAFRDLRKKNFQPVWEFLQDCSYQKEILVEGFSLLRLGERWEEIQQFDLREGP